MTEEPCTVCGERNPVRAQFCSFCGAYLGWDDEDEPTRPVLVEEPVVERIRSEQVVDDPGPDPPSGPAYRQVPPADPTTRLRAPVPSADRGIDPDRALRAEIAQHEVVVTPGGAPSPVTVHVGNTSSIVEGYDVSVVHPPPWLVVTPCRVQLLPGTDEDVQVLLSVGAEDLVPVQRARLRLRVQGESALPLRRDVSLDLVVGAVPAGLELRLEPSTLRARDSTTALFRVIVDNRRSNQAQRVYLEGHDPELAARFVFTPPELEVPPGTAVAARVRVDAPLPEPGEQLTRALTITASDGTATHQVRGSFAQAASEVVRDPPVTVRLDPSTIKVENASAGHTSVILDNRRGTRPQRVTVAADDDEGVVRFTISPERVDVPAGQSAVVRIALRAPRPDGGQEVTRDLTVTAWNGEEVSQAQGRFVQTSSDRRPMTRAALTALGSAAIVLGTFQAWTSNPRGTGQEWSFAAFDDFAGIPDDALLRALQDAQVLDLTTAVISAGAIALLLGVLALFGLTGSTGKLTRVAALLCFVFVLLFLVALNIRAGVGIGVGAIVVLVGCVAAYAGGHLARH